MAITLNNAQISKFRATNDVLKDFNGTVDVPVIIAVKGTEKIVSPLTYKQSDLTNDSIEVGGVSIEFSVSPRGGAKVYVGKLEDGSSVWVDLFGEFNTLRKPLNDATDKGTYRKMTEEEMARLTLELEDGVKREPSVPEGSNQHVYAYISIPLERKGRTLKVSNGTTTKKVEGTKVEKEEAISL